MHYACIKECDDGLDRLLLNCRIYSGYAEAHIPFEILYEGKFCKDFIPKNYLKMSDEELDAFYEEQERLEREESNKQK